METFQSPALNSGNQTIAFYIRNDRARKISLACDFVDTSNQEIDMKPEEDGLWSVELPLPPKGIYHYKFHIDECMYMEDVGNQHREPDGVNGWHSILTIG